MKSINQVISGLTKYIDAEILPHLSGAKKYGAAVYLALAEINAANYVKNVLSLPAIKMLGVSDGESVDIDKLYAAMSKSINDKCTIDVPIIGTFSFSVSDVDKLFDFIRREP